jgi:hypothetical protein
MNAAELTGQTDKDERPKRQRWFQDVFINQEIPKVQGIDLLSVTTTMEAGVRYWRIIGGDDVQYASPQIQLSTTSRTGRTAWCRGVSGGYFLSR